MALLIPIEVPQKVYLASQWIIKPRAKSGRPMADTLHQSLFQPQMVMGVQSRKKMIPIEWLRQTRHLLTFVKMVYLKVFV